MPAASKRPILVNAIAWLEISRGVLVISVLAAIYGGLIHEASLGPQLRFVLSVASNGLPTSEPLAGSPILPFFLAFTAILAIALGCGLLFLQTWARRFLMVTCGLSVAYFARALLFAGAMGYIGKLMHQIYFALALVNIVILLCLLDEEDVFSRA